MEVMRWFPSTTIVMRGIAYPRIGDTITGTSSGYDDDAPWGSNFRKRGRVAAFSLLIRR